MGLGKNDFGAKGDSFDFKVRMLKLLSKLAGNSSNSVSGFAKSIADANPAAVLPAPGVNLYNHISHILVTNSHATVGTLVDIIDQGGAILYTGYAAPAGGGFSCTLPTPLKQQTSNISVQAKCTTAGASVTVSVSGYKGA